MKEKIILIGGGGHCKVVIDAIRKGGIYDIAGIVDKDLKTGSVMLDIPVLGNDDELETEFKAGVKNAFISVGSIGDCGLRKKLYENALEKGFNFPKIIHPSAVIADDVEIGDGTFVAASVTVNTGAKIGKNVILNTQSSIDHDCKIGDFVHIAPGVKLSGGVKVGDESHIGISAAVVQNKTIGKRCFVKAKECVYKDLIDDEVWPAKKVDFFSFDYRKVFVIAEAGVNHNGNIEIARRMIDVAKEAGADAVKFQTFRAEAIASKIAPKADYQKSEAGSSENQVDMLKKYELDETTHKELLEYCKKKGIMFLSTPFDVESVDMLHRLGLQTFKVSSGEITNLPLLKKVGSLRGNVILSTGMADMDEVGSALDVLIKAGTPRENIILLHCNTAYPTPLKDVNLKAMLTMRQDLRIGVGYSDHTLGIEIPIAAAALGAQVIEKHFTLDRNMEGPDHKASLEPDELKDMVRAIRNIEEAMGSGEKTPSRSELKNKVAVRKSLVAACPIKKGETFTKDNIAVKRPGIGISPMHLHNVIGRTVTRDFRQDEVIEI